MLEPGSTIAERFQITKLLGRGGFGETYAAKDTTTGQDVAIKRLSLESAEDWKSIELFEREAAILESLNHPQIPDYVDFINFDDDDVGYLIQELAHGQPLGQMLLQGRRFSEDECLSIARQVLDILVYLSSLHPPVVHRDIKPDNLIYNEDGTVYLVDFGAVRELVGHTVSGSTMVGTLGYMAPEQLQGQAMPCSDIYGLGMTLVHLLTGQDPANLPKKRLKVDFQSQIELAPSFELVLDMMLEAVPEDRLASASDALTMLEGTMTLSPSSTNSSNSIDALVSQRIRREEEARAEQQRQIAKHRAAIARQKTDLAGSTRIQSDSEGYLLVYKPPLMARFSAERAAGVVIGLLGGIGFTAVIVWGILAGWNLAIMANVGIWSAFFGLAAFGWAWWSAKAVYRDQVNIRVNPNGNFLVYRSARFPLGYGARHELDIVTYPSGPDEVYGIASVRLDGESYDFRRVSDADVAQFDKFNKLTGGD